LVDGFRQNWDFGTTETVNCGFHLRWEYVGEEIHQTEAVDVDQGGWPRLLAVAAAGPDDQGKSWTRSAAADLQPFQPSRADGAWGQNCLPGIQPWPHASLPLAGPAMLFPSPSPYLKNLVAWHVAFAEMGGPGRMAVVPVRIADLLAVMVALG
jgi:hypothetical protein